MLLGCLLSVAPSLPAVMCTYRRLGRWGGERRWWLAVVGCSFLDDKKVCRSSGLRLEGSWLQAALAAVGNSTLESRKQGLTYTQKCFQSWREGLCFLENNRDAPEGRQDTVRYGEAKVGWYYKCWFPKMFVCFGGTSLELSTFGYI